MSEKNLSEMSLEELDTAEALHAAAKLLAADGWIVMRREDSRISLNYGYTAAKTAFVQEHTNTAKHISALLDCLTSKDTKEGYQMLLTLEAISDESNVLYPYTQQFADLRESKQYVIRVRGFRLLCKQAKWDTDGVLDKNIDRALAILHDPKPTAVRMALAALPDVLPYKPELWDTIQTAVQEIRYTQYKDSMQGLILKDMQRLFQKGETRLDGHDTDC